MPNRKLFETLFHRLQKKRRRLERERKVVNTLSAKAADPMNIKDLGTKVFRQGN